MKLRWFLSGTVREATQTHDHVRKIFKSQRDILSAEAIGEMEKSLKEVQDAIDSHADKTILGAKKQELETAANRWLKPYPHSEWRENVEVFLVAIAVAM